MDRHDETKYIFAQAIKDLIKVVPLDKIAVTDIVTRSGMTRQTFYRYFKDKYDLVNWYFEKLVLQSFRQMGNGCSLQEALQLKFAFINSEHSFFKEAFKSNDYNNLVNYDFNCIYEFYKGIIEKNLNHSVDDDLDFLLKMYCKGSIDMTVDWVLNDMPISIEKIVSLLIEALPKRLEPFILIVNS
ncbi:MULTISPECIES: TetR/AcrR family transcriptional regulator C-terminal domain-containing protein [unclassified Thomasclavelia]|uniref:TetR/AcrR family transcriptional regulator C-terminal domain-containing protein n=1 Tax=unclassified Thomasclavelia TaxID=3025756 RepID=UPI000B38AF8C|nr:MULTISPECIES: TetR/AcrR family transcriptional regulator C-terminal domain-containing protein [unclassified Thomasclavelia]OUP77837.1 TetR family transcriptional regulator [Erysipelatoclostridium sp. An173]OUQ07420.1 TetR family transcriptional regulator [Erysipelatoclostridium sp. An15]